MSPTLTIDRPELWYLRDFVLRAADHGYRPQIITLQPTVPALVAELSTTFRVAEATCLAWNGQQVPEEWGLHVKRVTSLVQGRGPLDPYTITTTQTETNDAANLYL